MTDTLTIHTPIRQQHRGDIVYTIPVFHGESPEQKEQWLYIRAKDKKRAYLAAHDIAEAAGWSRIMVGDGARGTHIREAKG